MAAACAGLGCSYPEFSKETKLCGAVDMLEGRGAIQRELDNLKRWAHGVT